MAYETFNLPPLSQGSPLPGVNSGSIVTLDANGNIISGGNYFSPSAGNIPALDIARNNILALGNALGAVNYTEYGAQDSIVPNNFLSDNTSANSFSAWGSPVGQPQPFNRVETDLQNNNPNSPVTEVRMRIRSVNESGAILADITIGVNAPVGAPSYRAVFDFGRQIVPIGNIWVEFFCNGITGARFGAYTYTVAAGYPEIKYATFGSQPTINGNIANLSNVGGLTNVWFRFSNSDSNYQYESQGPVGGGNYIGPVAEAVSTFTGWGGPIGAPQNFNRIEFDIVPFNTGNLPQNGRVRIFNNNQSGTLDAEKDIQIAIPFNLYGTATLPYRVIVDLDTLINNYSGSTLWLDFQFDGYVGTRSTQTVQYPVGSGYTNGVYTTTVYSNLVAATWTNVVTNFNIYVKCSYVSQNAFRIRSVAEAINLLNNFVALQQAPQIFLPSTLYAVEGHEFVLYFDNLIGPPRGSHGEYINQKYDFSVVTTGNTNLGTQYNERYSYTPATADVGGTFTLTVNVYFNGILVNTATSTLVVRGINALASNTRQLVTIGDSKTAGGQWLAELVNLANHNFASPGILSSLTVSALTATATTWAPHGLTTGATVTIGGVTTAGYAPTSTITVTGANTFTYTCTATISPAVSSNTPSYIWFSAGADALTITPVGALSATANDAQGNSRTVATDAVSGETIAFFSTNPTSSFAYSQSITAGGTQFASTATLADVSEIVAGTYVNLTGGTSEILVVASVNTGTKVVTFTSSIQNTGHTAANWFAFGKYLTTNSITFNSSDWVIFDLGVNDIDLFLTDTTCLAQIQTMILQLNAMIADIQATTSGVRIGIALITPPTRNQDAFGINYGISLGISRYRRNRELWLQAVLQNWGNKTASNIWVIPTGLTLDTMNNMSTAYYITNEYNTMLQLLQSNGVHPANGGYFQTGGAYWRFLRGQET